MTPPLAVVTARVYRMRVRSKAFVVSTLVIMAGVVAMIVLTAVLQDEDDRRSLGVGVIDGSPALLESLVDTGDQLDTDVRIEEFADQRAAEEAVQANDTDVATIDGERRWERDAPDIDSAIVRSALQTAATVERAEAQGIDPDALGDLLSPVPATDRFLEPEDSDRGVRIATATVG